MEQHDVINHTGGGAPRLISHRWTDPQSGRTVVATAEGAAPEGWPGWTIGVRDVVSAREILRLAGELASARALRDETVAEATRYRERIIALERENRAKCQELAEKAGEIQRLKEGLKIQEAESDSLAGRVVELEDAVVEDGFERARLKTALSGEKLLRSQADELRAGAFRDRELARRRITILELAVEDAIGHVEGARQAALKTPAYHQDLVAGLDLAHEVLCGAVRPRGEVPDAGPRVWRANGVDPVHQPVPRVGAAGGAPGVETARAEPVPRPAEDLVSCLRERVAQLERDLGHLGAATNPAGQQPASVRLFQLEHDMDKRLGPAVAKLCDRLEALEESRGNHAVMLTDHADRLKKIPVERIACLEARVAALEAGKE